MCLLLFSELPSLVNAAVLMEEATTTTPTLSSEAAIELCQWTFMFQVIFCSVFLIK